MKYNFAALVDVDGLLVNNKNHFMKTYNEALAHFGMETLSEEEMLKKNSADQYNFIKNLGLGTEERFKYLAGLWDENLRTNRHGISLYDGAAEFLENLSSISSVVLVTNSHSHQIEIYKNILGMGDYKVVTRDDVTKPKPQPEHLVKAMEIAGSRFYKTAVVDDMPETLVTAKRLGMHPIGVSWGYSSSKSLEEVRVPVVGNFDELLEEINVLGNLLNY